MSIDHDLIDILIWTIVWPTVRKKVTKFDHLYCCSNNILNVIKKYTTGMALLEEAMQHVANITKPCPDIRSTLGKKFEMQTLSKGNF